MGCVTCGGNWKPSQSAARYIAPADFPLIRPWSFTTNAHKSTIRAINRSMREVKLGTPLIITDQPAMFPSDWETVQVEKCTDQRMLCPWWLSGGIGILLGKSEYLLSIQYDGFAVNGEMWDNRFFDYDFIGAPWADGNVGNNGFGFMSNRYVQAVLDLNIPPTLEACHPSARMLAMHMWEGRKGYRGDLEQKGIKVASFEIASKFSHETPGWGQKSGYEGKTFGFHGIMDLAEVVRLSLYD